MKLRNAFNGSFDRYLSQLLNGWTVAYPMPVDGRAKLLDQATHQRNYPRLWLDVAFAISRWSFRNFILEPIDIALQPVLYFSEVDLYPTYVADKMLHQSFIG